MSHPTHLLLQDQTTSLLLDCEGPCLPRVLHWGAPLGDPGEADVAQLRAALAHHPMHNGLPDEGYQVSLLPEQWTGWSGHPGLSGSRQGRAWAPRFLLEGVEAQPEQLVVRAVDPDAGLQLELTWQLHPGGLLRTRARLANTGEDGYQLDQLLLSLPVPSRATELLDFAGRWGKERVPQRAAMGVGTHWREGRHGRTGADSAFVLHLGEPGFGFRRGQVWSVHTGWSGNHVHYAERVLTG